MQPTSSLADWSTVSARRLLPAHPQDSAIEAEHREQGQRFLGLVLDAALRTPARILAVLREHEDGEIVARAGALPQNLSLAQLLQDEGRDE